MLKRRRLIDTSQNGEVSVLGLTTGVTVQHAGDIFEQLEPTAEERATILLADLTSVSPVRQKQSVYKSRGTSQRWNPDFISDASTDGRRFRVLAVVDDFTRECLALVTGTALVNSLPFGQPFKKAD